MKKNNPIIPKKIINSSLLSNLLSYSICSILIGGVFLCLSVYQGLSLNIKQNSIKKYTSHITAYSSTFSTNNAKQFTSWWDNTIERFEQTPTSIPFFRGSAKRSSLSTVIITTNQEYPVYTTIISNNDHRVFDNFMAFSATETIITNNAIHIGRSLATHLNIERQDLVSLYIPEFNKTVSNLTVAYIFNSDDNFYNNYGVFIHQLTLSNIIDSRFQKYHIRFFATPFINIIETNIESFVTGEKKYTDEYLEYQYDQLNYWKNQIILWGYLMYVLCGLILFFNNFLNYHIVSDDMQAYLYQAGLLSKITLYIPYLLKILKQIVIIHIPAFAILYIFLLFPPLTSKFFLINQSLYPDFNLPLTNYFSVKFPDSTLPTLVFFGIIITVVSSFFLMFLYYLSKSSLKSKNKQSYIIIGIVLFIVLGFISSDKLIYHNFAEQARLTHWSQYFFGKYTLTDKDYHHYKSLNLPPKSFLLSQDILKILEENSIEYLTVLEKQGTLSLSSDTDNTNNDLFKKDVSVKSLQGNITYLSNILLPIQSNGIVIGKNIADFFNSNQLIYLNINGDDSSVPLVVSDIVNIPIDDFNDTVFLNHTNLTYLLQQDISTVSKLQSLRGKKILNNYTNKEIILNNLKNNTKNWRILTNISLSTEFITTLIFSAIYSILTLMVIIYLHIINKENIILYYIWGLPFESLRYYYILSLVSFLAGIIIAWIKNLITLIMLTPIPEFLQKDTLVPNKLFFSVDLFTVPVLSLWIICIFMVNYLIFKYIFQHYQYKLINYEFKKNY